MKNKQIIAICIIGEAILYFLFAFSLWEFNPKYWYEGARVVFAFISFVVSAFVIMSIGINLSKNN